MAVKWRESKYASYFATLAPGLELSVAYEGKFHIPEGEPKWNVIVFGQKLRDRCMTADLAKHQAEAVAEAVIAKAVKELRGDQ